jgi:hypothetical protein
LTKTRGEDRQKCSWEKEDLMRIYRNGQERKRERRKTWIANRVEKEWCIHKMKEDECRKKEKDKTGTYSDAQKKF